MSINRIGNSGGGWYNNSQMKQVVKPLTPNQQVELNRKLALVTGANETYHAFTGAASSEALFAEWNKQAGNLFAPDVSHIIIAEKGELSYVQSSFGDLRVAPIELELFKPDSLACKAFENNSLLYLPDVYEPFVFLADSKGTLYESILKDLGVELGALGKIEELKSMAFCPIYYESDNSKLGMIFLGSKKDKYLDPMVDLTALKSLSDQFAVALRSRQSERFGII